MCTLSIIYMQKHTRLQREKFWEKISREKYRATIARENNIAPSTQIFFGRPPQAKIGGGAPVC
jgi:hypothetical protein